MNTPKPILSYKEFLVNEAVNPELAKLSSIPGGKKITKEVNPELSGLNVGKKGAGSKSPNAGMAKIETKGGSAPKSEVKPGLSDLNVGGHKTSKTVAPKFADLNVKKKAATKKEVSPKFAELKK